MTSLPRNFFAVYSPLLRHTVTWPTMGNHEGYTSSGVTGNRSLLRRLCAAGTGRGRGRWHRGRRVTTPSITGRCTFVCLNSHDVSRAPEGEMAQWLREDLSRT